jgi:hypothetical protein
MALRVTASIVELTTSMDEKSRPVILDMVAEKTVLLSSAMSLAAELSIGSAKRRRGRSIGLFGK